MVFSDSDVYKWLEAIAWELGREPSAELERLARETTELVAAAQEPDGYLNSLVPGRRPRVAVDRPGDGPRALLRRPPVPGRSRVRASDGRHDSPHGRPSLRRPDRRGVRRGHRHAHRRTSRGRGRARRAVPADGRAALPRARRHAHRPGGGSGCSRAAASTSTTTRTPSPFATHARSSGTPCAPSISRPASPTSTPRRATRRCSRRCSRQWDDLTSAKTYLTGGIGSRHHGEAIGDPYELPPDRAYCETCAAIASIMWNWRMLLVTGESRFADLLERTLYNGFLSGLSLDGAVVLLRRTRCSRATASGATAGTLSRAARPTSCGCSRRCTTTSRRPRRDGRPAASVRVVDDPRRRARRGPGRARRRDGLSVVGHRRRSRSSRAAMPSGRSRSGSRHGRGRRSVDGEPVAPGIRGADAALARRRPRRPRARRLAEAHRAEPADRRRSRVRRPRARPGRLLLRGARPSRRRRSGRRRRRPGGRPRRQRAGGAAGRPARAWRSRASSATSTAGGRPSTATSESCRRRRQLRRSCSPFPTSRGRTGTGAGCGSGSPRRTRTRRRRWRPCRSSS